MRPLRFRSIVTFVSVGAAAAGVVSAACEGDETSTAPAAPDGSTAAQADGSTSGPPQDGGGDPDAGGILEVGDGGSEPPEEDGGLTDPDGGFDAGPACQPLTAGAFVTTTCATGPVRVGSPGALTTTTYELLGVTVLGNTEYCARGGGYVPYDHRGALRVTASSPTTAKFEFLDQYARSGSGSRISTRRYDVAVTAENNLLTYAPEDCRLSRPPASATFTIGSVDGKKTMTLRLPWGADSFALYRYREP